MKYFIKTFHAIKFGHTVAFESAQPVITNVRNLFEGLVAEQLTIKATEKKNCKRKDASSLDPSTPPFIDLNMALYPPIS